MSESRGTKQDSNYKRIAKESAFMVMEQFLLWGYIKSIHGIKLCRTTDTHMYNEFM